MNLKLSVPVLNGPDEVRLRQLLLVGHAPVEHLVVGRVGAEEVWRGGGHRWESGWCLYRTYIILA